MENVILVLSVMAIFIFGYFIMKKLDISLAKNQFGDSLSASTLRIGFESPVMIDAMAALLEHFSKENSNCEMYLFYGSANEIKSGIENQGLDFGILENWVDNGAKSKIQSLSLSIRQSAIASESVGLMVYPLNQTEKQVRVIWESNDNHMKEILLNVLRTSS